MLKSIAFQNFRALRNTTLPLGRCTVIVGPNGSGKSTVLQAVALRGNAGSAAYPGVITAELRDDEEAEVSTTFCWDDEHGGAEYRIVWKRGLAPQVSWQKTSPANALTKHCLSQLDAARVYSLDAAAISAPVQLAKNIELGANGSGMAGVLDGLRDHNPDRFEKLNEELGNWIPEFDRILFDVPDIGRRTFSLRRRQDHVEIPAADLSQGTLMALAILTLAYLPQPPSIVGLEEPDHGIHPRLLRRVQDAIYRLCYPENFGETRPPVQVIATTHSPHFLDLFKDSPDEIVIAEKEQSNVRFRRLSEHPHIQEVLADAPLGDVWYSGVLGGVPTES